MLYREWTLLSAFMYCWSQPSNTTLLSSATAHITSCFKHITSHHWQGGFDTRINKSISFNTNLRFVTKSLIVYLIPLHAQNAWESKMEKFKLCD